MCIRDRPKTGPEKLAQDLKDLGTRGDDELKERWRNLFGTEPPRKIHRSLLLPAIAYRMQENAFGALKPSVRRHLLHVARNAVDGQESPGYPSLSPGVTSRPPTRNESGLDDCRGLRGLGGGWCSLQRTSL